MPAKVKDADERIRACTIAEIEKNGIVGLRVANIAKQAGVSVPLIYKLFGDREQLLATVLSESIETFYLTDINNIRALVEKSKSNITVKVLLQGSTYAFGCISFEESQTANAHLCCQL